MTESSYAQSIKARLLNMADGDNKKYQQLIVRFFHERLLFRLSKSKYRERFILKGAHCYMLSRSSYHVQLWI